MGSSTLCSVGGITCTDEDRTVPTPSDDSTTVPILVRVFIIVDDILSASIISPLIFSVVHPEKISSSSLCRISDLPRSKPQRTPSLCFSLSSIVSLSSNAFVSCRRLHIALLSLLFVVPAIPPCRIVVGLRLAMNCPRDFC